VKEGLRGRKLGETERLWAKADAGTTLIDPKEISKHKTTALK